MTWVKMQQPAENDDIRSRLMMLVSVSLNEALGGGRNLHIDRSNGKVYLIYSGYWHQWENEVS